MSELAISGGTEREQVEKFYGKYPGQVLDNKPAAGQAHVGELLVEVHGILEEAPTGQGTRGMQVWAKPCFLPGFFFIPEVGAKVWVEFAAGNINDPLWTGVWYPIGAVPLTADGQAPTELQKVIRTAAGQSGHVIQLDDSSGAEKLIIADNNGNSITLDRNGITLKAAGGAIEMGATGVKVSAGDGSMQFIVLGQLLEWLKGHQHTGNMGAPTPLFPADTVKLESPNLTSGQ